jgi:hypothetical protein
MPGVVVLLEAERLATDGLVDIGELSSEDGEFFRGAVVSGGERRCEFVTEKPEAIGAEKAAAEEVEERLEDDFFADAEDARVAGGVGGGDAAPVDELAAVLPTSRTSSAGAATARSAGWQSGTSTRRRTSSCP